MFNTYTQRLEKLWSMKFHWHQVENFWPLSHHLLCPWSTRLKLSLQHRLINRNFSILSCSAVRNLHCALHLSALNERSKSLASDTAQLECFQMLQLLFRSSSKELLHYCAHIGLSLVTICHFLSLFSLPKLFSQCSEYFLRSSGDRMLYSRISMIMLNCYFCGSFISSPRRSMLQNWSRCD